MSPQTRSDRPVVLAETHEVSNQPPPLEGYNLFEADVALREGVAREGAAWALENLQRYGEICGRPEVIELGFLANEYKPQLDTHDRYGHRVDEVRYHASYHQLMKMAFAEGLHSVPWTDSRPGAQVARAAQYYLHAQVEAAHGCPVTMTFAAVPTLKLTPVLAEQWLPKVLARALVQYNFRDNNLNIINYSELSTGSCGASRAGVRLRS